MGVARWALLVAVVLSAGALRGVAPSLRKEGTSAGVVRNQNGEPLPRGAVLRLGTSRLRHHARLLFVALSPNGTRAASTGDDDLPGHPIRIWDPRTGKELSRLVGHARPAANLTFSPN